jgi:hypothetical protein
MLPRKIASLNGVPVRYVRLFDVNDTLPEYEESLLTCIREWVNSGKSAVVVGGGAGVSTVVTAQNVDNDGTVTVYEGNADQADLVAETVDLNYVAPTIRIRQAVVGEARSVWGGAGDSEVVPPKDLPECDVLVMDCEGAESPILESMTVQPNVIIVETHGHLDSPTEQVTSLLNEQGYEVVDKHTGAGEKGIDVLAGLRRGQEST